MQDFRKLEVWNKAHKFTLKIYVLTKVFPDVEKFGLTSQLRRATSSIPTNVSEGCGHSSAKEKARFIQIAIASSSEVDYLIELCTDLGYLEEKEDLTKEIIEIRKMLVSLRSSVLR
jgi:four helix bundle protein